MHRPTYGNQLLEQNVDRMESGRENRLPPDLEILVSAWIFLLLILVSFNMAGMLFGL